MHQTYVVLRILLTNLFSGRTLQILSHSPLETQITCGALAVFAAIFLVAGLYRIVEIRDSTLSPRSKTLATILHSIGVFDFSWTIFLLAADPLQLSQAAIMPFFVAGILLLFPLHIYLALLRRIR